MRQNLFEIPLDGPPGFGLFGVPMALWVLFGGVWLWQHRRELGARSEFVAGLVTWLVVAAVIASLPTLIGLAFRMGWEVKRSLPIRGYGFMLAVGFLLACADAARRARKVGLPNETIWDLSLWLFGGGILGARIFYVVQYSDGVFQDVKTLGEAILAFMSLWDGGLVFYGSVIGGALGFLYFAHRKRKEVHPLMLADVIVPSIFIGLAFGRIGCLLNGCCFGDRCELPWAMTFPAGSVPFKALVIRGFLPEDATATFPLHPTQVYSSLNAFLLAWLTAVYFRHRPTNGAVLALAMLTYPVTRFAIETLRGDEMGQLGTALTISQWVSIGLFAAGWLFVYWLWRRKSARPAGDIPGEGSARDVMKPASARQKRRVPT